MTKKQLVIACNTYVEKVKQDILDNVERIEDLGQYLKSYPQFEVPKQRKKTKQNKEATCDASMKQAEIWLQNIHGIQYYVDREDNVYLVEDFLTYSEQQVQQPLKKYGKVYKNEETGQYEINNEISESMQSL